MAETHELRLKINAAAAKSGSREFVAAISSIKRSIIDLDKTSGGIFKRLSKNAQDAGKAARTAIKPIDKSATRSLSEFAKAQAQAMRQTANSRRGLTSLTDGLRTVATSYNLARTANEALTQSVTRSNTALARQAQLLTQTRSATATTGGRVAAAPRVDNRAGDQQVAMQNRVKRAVDDTRLSVERLTVQLLKVGGFSQIQQVGAAFNTFKKSVGGAVTSTAQLDNAKTKLNATMRQAQTAAVTLNAKLAEETRATKAAADATRQKDRANMQVAASSRAAAQATAAHNTALAKQEKLSISAASANRRAAEEVAKLSQRLRAVGDTRGLAQLNAALNQFRSSTAGGVASATQLRTAVSTLAEATTRAKVGLTNMEGAQTRASRSARELAGSEAAAARNARRVEQEMRSISGAAGAASRSMRQATGSMRGLENAFSTTFQIGSAFRAMIGSITFGTFIQSVFAAGAALNQFQVAMEVATGSMQGALGQMQFINSMSRELGIGLRGAREDFAKFAVSANLAGVATGTARDIFRSVSQAMTVMGRGAEDQRLAFLALEQMLSKNVVSSEELRRQLGERLPGAVNLMARAVGVTTGELQKMLKAGELIAADVLPKFAKEVDKAFGPGLERALERAPAALGRFRNELEFFLSTIADSGFMDALALGFNNLTNALRSSSVADSAEKIGAGLVDLATIASGFAIGFIDNIETIGVVAKAVFGGIVARQIVIMMGALLTGTSRSALGFSTLTAALTANTAAMTAQTTAATATTAATTALSGAQVRQTLATDAQVIAALRANGTFGAMPGIMARAAAATSAMGIAAGRAAAGMTILSRGFFALAGPIGIGIAALSLVPLLFSDTGDAAEDMADMIEGAVARSGAAMEELTLISVDSAAQISFDRVTSDLDALSSGLTNFVSKNSGLIQGLRSTVNGLQGDLKTGFFNSDADKKGLEFFGIAEEAFDGLSAAGKRAGEQIVVMTAKAATGEETWVNLAIAIQRAISRNPDASGILEPLREFAKESALVEIAILRNKDKLVEFFGTDDDRAVQGFVKLAAQAVETGKGFEGLAKDISVAKRETPELVSQLEDIQREALKAFALGNSSLQFRIEVQGTYAEVVAEIQSLRDAANVTAQAAAASMGTFEEAAKGMQESLSQATDSTKLITDVDSMINSFVRFQDAALSVEGVGVIFDSLQFPTDEAKKFADEVERQFSILDPAQQTYDNLRRILGEVATSSEFAGQGMASLAAKIASSVRASVNAGRTAEDLRADLIALLETEGFTADEADRMAGSMLGAADAASTTGRASAAAEQGVLAVAQAALEAGDAGNVGAEGLKNLAGAFASIAKGGLEVATEIRTQITKIQRDTELKKKDFVTRSVLKATDKIGEEINKVNAKFATEIEGLGKLPDGALNGIKQRQREELDALGALQRELGEAVRTNVTTKTNNTGRLKNSSGSKKLSKADQEAAARAAQNHALALAGLTKTTDEYLFSLNEENAALAILASGMTTSQKGAEMLAEAQALGLRFTEEQTRAFFDQIEAAEALNRALTAMANDPVNDWMNGVPIWREAGQIIERDVFDSLSNSISEMIQTGKFDFESLGASILGTIADVVADKAVKELATLLGGNTTGSGEGGFGLGGLLADAFGNGGSLGDQADPLAAGGVGGQPGPQILSALATGGNQAAEAIRAAMVQAAQQVRSAITGGGAQAGASINNQVGEAGTRAGGVMKTEIVAGGNQAGTSISSKMSTASNSGGITLGEGVESGSQAGGNIFSKLFSGIGSLFGGGGGGGGGGLGGIFSTVLGAFFSEGGTTGSPVSSAPVPVSAFRHAPSFAAGTTNTSGIPAILHDNEAVVPLSRGRKIPVDIGGMDEASGGRGGKVLNQVFNIQTPDADSFRKSQKQLAADALGAGQRALDSNG